MSRGILLLLNLIPSVQSLFVKSFCGRKHFIRISERQITSFLQYVCVWLHQTDKTKQKTKIIRTQSNFTFPRKWSWSVQNIKQGPTEYHTEGMELRLSPGTYREYGKEKEDPHRAGDEELLRIN